jgi:hypothetical protein
MVQIPIRASFRVVVVTDVTAAASIFNPQDYDL